MEHIYVMWWRFRTSSPPRDQVVLTRIVSSEEKALQELEEDVKAQTHINVGSEAHAVGAVHIQGPEELPLPVSLQASQGKIIKHIHLEDEEEGSIDDFFITKHPIDPEDI